MVTMKLAKRRSGWWISTDEDEMGPYNTRAEVVETRERLEEFYKYEADCPGGNKCRCSKRKL